MRRLSIEHVTEYRFAEPVTLLEHRLLLRPREDHAVRIASSRLVTDPPSAVRWQRDVLDNSLARVRFGIKADLLRISSHTVVELFDETPLDFVVDERAVTHPFQYSESEARLLAPFLAPSTPGDQGAVLRWLGEIGIGPVAEETFVRLQRLNRAISDRFRYQERSAEGVQSPAETLTRGVGSCRDFAALFVDSCRCLGIASRFVSGYLYAATAGQTIGGSTHAWADVYLPGPGWKGFDPTSGEVTGSDHIAVAVARDAQAVPPVAGSFLAAPTAAPALYVSVSVRPQ